MVTVTYVPLFVTMLFRGMPGLWKGRHRLMLCWLVFMQALFPGHKTLEELARWTPAQVTAWRFRRLLKASWPRSGDRPLYALRGGLSGAGASSTDSNIAANIERGFCPKKRSAAVVPSGRVRKKL